MAKKAFIHIGNKTIRVRPDTEDVAAGETLLGLITHSDAGTEDNIGHKASHVLYQHIQDLMYRAKHYDIQRYSILV